jgi:hypothetical protein
MKPIKVQNSNHGPTFFGKRRENPETCRVHDIKRPQKPDQTNPDPDLVCIVLRTGGYFLNRLIIITKIFKKIKDYQY